jgi:hypothetical protein
MLVASDAHVTSGLVAAPILPTAVAVTWTVAPTAESVDVDRPRVTEETDTPAMSLLNAR